MLRKAGANIRRMARAKPAEEEKTSSGKFPSLRGVSKVVKGVATQGKTVGMKKGGMADKSGRAMKRKTADTKGRAMKKGK